ncbi:MAG: cytochrome c class IC:cytochrome c class I [Gammaproteobacteria bacterium]|nr:MAG: cytochrome c class IC:cytochrome c class I [Gammaproteobacteria bacterium]TND04338.1 MAG: cytochrome c, class IC:cytochrome c, class I [Gammaproteobacteria bacterium]
MRIASSAGLLLLVALFVLTACERTADTSNVETTAGSGIKRVNDPDLIATGQQVYRANCAQCHGEGAEGATNWRQPGAGGRYPAPPLNGTGHAWHHSTAVLTHMIKNGSEAGRGDMPAWGGKLSDDEIRAVIAWFQSLWPDPVYAAWYEMQQRSPGQ